MKLSTSLVSLALLAAAAVDARVVRLENAPYAKRDVAASLQEHEVALPRAEAAKSVLHNRVARHIRPETPSDIRRRQVLGPVTDLGGITDFKGKDPEPVRGEKGLPFLHESNSELIGSFDPRWTGAQGRRLSVLLLHPRIFLQRPSTGRTLTT